MEEKEASNLLLDKYKRETRDSPYPHREQEQIN